VSSRRTASDRQLTLPLGRPVHGGETAGGTRGADAPVEGGAYLLPPTPPNRRIRDPYVRWCDRKSGRPPTYVDSRRGIHRAPADTGGGFLPDAGGFGLNRRTKSCINTNMSQAAKQKKAKKKPVIRYGTGELYGFDFAALQSDRIRALANAAFKSQPCPFRGGGIMCNKKGGVCSLRQFSKTGADVAPLQQTSLVATCPWRFYDAGVALSWAGRTLLDTDAPIILTELPFLMSTATNDVTDPSTVGKIDMVLVHPNTAALRWCALEVQAVYFSGASMSEDFNVMKKWAGPGIPFPQGIRRPDFRSSGPKRLMPQLQIKVPTISRWGNKMAVVVDLPFWESLASITEVDHVSNCDIAWFVVKYRHDGTRFCLEPAALHLTTLDRAVEGLTGGKPTSLADFERTLLSKLADAPNRSGSTSPSPG